MSELALLRGGAALGAAGTLLGALAPAAGLALVGIVAAGAGISICAPVLFSIAGRGADEAVRGAAVSIVTTIAYLGFLVGPAAVGPAGERHGARDEPRRGGRRRRGAGHPGARERTHARVRIERQAAARPLAEARGPADQELG